MVVVRGLPFLGKAMEGDFVHMIRDARYAKTVLVFNDNVVDAADTHPHNGAGSAGIRTWSLKYAPDGPPRAIGIPTGWSVASGGFKMEDGDLEPFAARAITLAFERLVLACLKFDVTEIIYSCDPNDPNRRRLGSGIFKLDQQILTFIEDKLHRLPDRIAEGSKFTEQRIDELDRSIAHVARLHERLARRSSLPGTLGTLGKRPFCAVDRLVIREQPAHDDDLLFVGRMRDGSYVYEKRPQHGGGGKRAFFRQATIFG